MELGKQGYRGIVNYNGFKTASTLLRPFLFQAHSLLLHRENSISLPRAEGPEHTPVPASALSYSFPPSTVQVLSLPHEDQSSHLCSGAVK